MDLEEAGIPAGFSLLSKEPLTGLFSIYDPVV